MRNRLLKVYTILIVLGLILFAFFISKKAFMGKHLKLLHNAEQDVASGAPAPAPTPGGTDLLEPRATLGRVVTTDSNAQLAPADTASGAEPTPQPSPSPTLGDPEKGGIGEALKKIRGNREKQNESLEKSFNTPE